MYYTESEIVGSYVRSGCKASQIKVLAELNATGTDDESVAIAKHNVIAVLKKNGVLKADRKETRGRKKAAKNAPKEEKKHPPALIPPDIRVFDSPVREVNYWRWETGEITGNKIAVRMTKETEQKPDVAAGADDMAKVEPKEEKPTEEKQKQAAGAKYEYTAEEFRKGFLFMANYVADCITAMDEIDPKAPDADKLRAAYIRDIEDVQEFLSEIRIKKDDDTSNKPKGIQTA